jgi:hypothetical protein
LLHGDELLAITADTARTRKRSDLLPTAASGSRALMGAGGCAGGGDALMSGDLAVVGLPLAAIWVEARFRRELD